MGYLRGIFALGIFFLLAPLFLFSTGIVLVFLWSVVGSVLPFILYVSVFCFMAILLIGLMLAISEIRKNKKFTERFKTYKYNRIPSHFYLYK